MQQILKRVCQNFGKIRVVPQFSGDELVPVEVSDIEEELERLSAEEEQEEEQPGEKDEAESYQESLEEPGGGNTKAVMKALDEKIARYQKFLNKAKVKKSLAVRISKGLSKKVFAKPEEQRKSFKENDTAPS
ncbi:Nucleolar GTP-binding protein 2 [Sciurus carolinensis]|uniref:Nucleolar GTP-binding protein 2 n=1 Tax=Sciurus carolinensis TaxID=30640 RepID=A0AA41NJR8_SCICA|nr:Nucleolar GTP-binding protein 2 [Sciurus carolinensis]